MIKGDEIKVDFMILGAQKCGTTTLSEILRNHPSFEACRTKEPHFFSQKRDWRKYLDEYHSLFSLREDALYFEASTTYTFYPHRKFNIWDDLYEYNPKLKFIYLVRNPIDRIISSYMHSYEKGHTDLAIEDAIINERFFLDITRYYTQISPFIERFGREKVLIIDFEDLINNQNETLQKVSDFLLIDSDKFSTSGNVHSNKSVGGNKIHHKFDSPSLYLKIIRKLSPRLWRNITDNADRSFHTKPKLEKVYKEMIIRFLTSEIMELQKLMDKNLNNWLKID
ncbi:MAG TPA: sulfotransferase [Bacteroidales bacterium]|nr:sulfotransferase [Bacteroidales bacterium]